MVIHKLCRNEMSNPLTQQNSRIHFCYLSILYKLATTALRASAAHSGSEATLLILSIDNSSHCPNGLIDVSWTPPPLPAITYNFRHLLLPSSSPKQAHNFKHLLLPSSSPSKPYYQNFSYFFCLLLRIHHLDVQL